MAQQTLESLQAQLQKSFFPPASAGLDAVIRLSVAGETLAFRVADATISFEEAAGKTPDATFYFSDMETAWNLLSGRGDAFSAFMQGTFRADGYLMWAFTMMAMFQSESLPENPVE